MVSWSINNETETDQHLYQWQQNQYIAESTEQDYVLENSPNQKTVIRDKWASENQHEYTLIGQYQDNSKHIVCNPGSKKYQTTDVGCSSSKFSLQKFDRRCGKLSHQLVNFNSRINHENNEGVFAFNPYTEICGSTESPNTPGGCRQSQCKYLQRIPNDCCEVSNDNLVSTTSGFQHPYDNCKQSLESCDDSHEVSSTTELRYSTKHCMHNERMLPVRHGPDEFGSTYHRRGSLQLWQFLVSLLDNPVNTNFISWTGKGFEFKLIEPEEVARRWGIQKNRPAMNYDKLSRSLRYYYEKGIMQKVAGERYVYRFVCDPESITNISQTKSTVVNNAINVANYNKFNS